jgi:hypothetical protein
MFEMFTKAIEKIKGHSLVLDCDTIVFDSITMDHKF